MKRGEIEKALLEALYKISRRGGGPVIIDEVIRDWGESRDRVLRIADFMRRKKDPWIKFVETGPTLEITKEGIEEYERTHKGK